MWLYGVVLLVIAVVVGVWVARLTAGRNQAPPRGSEDDPQDTPTSSEQASSRSI